MAFRVEITPPAEQDANAILEWLLSQHAGEAGLRWFSKLKASYRYSCGIAAALLPRS